MTVAVLFDIPNVARARSLQEAPSGGAGIQRRSDNCSCALAKGEPEEGGFPGRAFEEGLRVSIRSVVRLSTVASECLLPRVSSLSTSVKRSCGIHVRCGRIRVRCANGSVPL